jgi:hypothetical protein
MNPLRSDPMEEAIVSLAYLDLPPGVLLAGILALVEGELSITGEEEDHRLYSVEEVFSEFHAGDILRGLRGREEMTQAKLAAEVGF